MAIIGQGPRSLNIPNDYEVWVINGDRTLPDRWDRVYQLHTVDHMYDRHGQEYMDWLRSIAEPKKLITVAPDPRLPNAEAYPWQQILAARGKDYFTHSTPLLMAQAIEEGASRIILDGFSDRIGLEHERACVEYHVGYARAKGVEVEVTPQYQLFDHDGVVYGLEEAKWKAQFVNKPKLEATLVDKPELAPVWDSELNHWVLVHPEHGPMVTSSQLDYMLDLIGDAGFTPAMPKVDDLSASLAHRKLQRVIRPEDGRKLVVAPLPNGEYTLIDIKQPDISPALRFVNAHEAIEFADNMGSDIIGQIPPGLDEEKFRAALEIHASLWAAPENRAALDPNGGEEDTFKPVPTMEAAQARLADDIEKVRLRKGMDDEGPSAMPVSEPEPKPSDSGGAQAVSETELCNKLEQDKDAYFDAAGILPDNPVDLALLNAAAKDVAYAEHLERVADSLDSTLADTARMNAHVIRQMHPTVMHEKIVNSEVRQSLKPRTGISQKLVKKEKLAHKLK